VSILEQRKSAITAARKIAEKAKADGRAVTPDELDTINGYLDAVKSLDIKIANAKSSEDLLARLGSLDGDTDHERRQGGDSSSAPQYLDLSAIGRRSMATEAGRAMVGIEQGRKSILPAGETFLSVPTLPSTPVVSGKQFQTLLSLLPVIKIPAGASARYLRQTTRTNNAAAVAPGGTKPTSIYGLSPVDAVLSVYAHLSESQDRFMLEDASLLADWVASELLYGLWEAVEKDVIAGAPVDPAPGITGILSTSGVRTQAFATDILTTSRAAIAASEALGYADSLVFVLSPTDWAAAQLATASTSGTFQFPGAPAERPPGTLWGVPVTVSTGLPVKVGLLLNTSGLALYTDVQGVRVDWGTPGDSWSKNEIVARCEGRFDLGVLQPAGQVRVATAA
jgi:HK97 family phage major capsid protein